MANEQPERLREITDGTALSQVVNDAANPALVLFDAAWCSPARRIEERLLRMSRGQGVALVRVNVDRVPELARRFAIHAVPTLALFRAGHLAATRLGDVEDGDLQLWLDRECVADLA
jgi:thioredoxin 2